MQSPPIADIRAAIDRDGYYVTEPVFTPERMAAFQAAVEARWQAAIADAERNNPAALPMVRTRAFLIQNHRQAPIFMELMTDPWMLALAEGLIGPDVDLTWSQAIVKPGRIGRSLAWHQDGQYAPTEPMESGFTVLLAVTDMTLENGCVWALPGRHKEGLLPHEWSAERNEWQGQYDTAAKVPVVMRAGQMLVFTRQTPHYSGTNDTDTVRISYQIGYGRPGAVLLATRAPFGDQVPLLRGGDVLVADR